MSDPTKNSTNDILVKGAAIEQRVRNIGLTTFVKLDKIEVQLYQIEKCLERLETKIDDILEREKCLEEQSFTPLTEIRRSLCDSCSIQ